MHDAKAGIPGRDRVLNGNTHDLSTKFTSFLDTARTAVVACIRTVSGDVVTLQNAVQAVA